MNNCLLKYTPWIFLAAIAVWGFGCGQGKPGAAGASASGGSHTLIQPADDPNAKASAEADKQVNDIPAPPPNAQFTILCMSFTEDGHLFHSNLQKADLIRDTKRKGWYVVHTEQESDLYYGYYSTYDEKVDVHEARRALADREYIRTLTDANQTLVFAGAAFVNINQADPPAPPEWEIANCKGYWTLQVAVYRDSPQRKQDAVDQVRLARSKGVDAYFHHEAAMSDVFYGSWPKEAVKVTNVDQPLDSDPTKPLLVPSEPINLAPGQRVVNADGREMQVINPPSYEIVDQSLRNMIADYPNTLVNGYPYGKELETRDHKRTFVAQPSYLIKVHPEPQSTAVQPAASGDDLAPVLPTGKTPSEMGHLKSIGQ